MERRMLRQATSQNQSPYQIPLSVVSGAIGIFCTQRRLGGGVVLEALWGAVLRVGSAGERAVEGRERAGRGEGLGGIGEEPEQELVTAGNPEHDGSAKTVDGKVDHDGPPSLVLGGVSLLSAKGLGARLDPDDVEPACGDGGERFRYWDRGIFMSKSGLITTTRPLLTGRSCCFRSTPTAGPATQRTRPGTAHHPTGQPPRLLTLRGRPETLGLLPQRRPLTHGGRPLRLSAQPDPDCAPSEPPTAKNLPTGISVERKQHPCSLRSAKTTCQRWRSCWARNVNSEEARALGPLRGPMASIGRASHRGPHLCKLRRGGSPAMVERLLAGIILDHWFRSY